MWPFVRRSRLAPIERLHDSIAMLARDPILFTEMGVSDDFEGRFEILVLHFALVLRRLGQLPPPAGDLAQELTDCVFKHLDEGLREIGVGDLGVPKRMKKLAKAFYGRAAAYDAALAAGDREGLTEALRRNVFAGGEGDAGRLASRVEALAAGLSGLELEALLAGGIAALGRPRIAAGEA
jgi:cytochrome b pre-mRNA-processing protein 3